MYWNTNRQQTEFKMAGRLVADYGVGSEDDEPVCISRVFYRELRGK